MRKSQNAAVDPKSGFLSDNRRESFRSILSSLICVAAGILVGVIVLFILALSTDSIPLSDATNGIFIILGGPFASGSARDIAFTLGDMLFKSAPLILTGLSVSIAFQTGLFNIGAPGQYLMGAMGAVIVALSIPTDGTVSAFFVWLLALVVGTLCGMIWGAIPGLFKAFFDVNEVIVCIMTNWIAANVVSWVFKGSRFVNIAGGKSAYTLPTASNGVQNPKCGLDKLFAGSNMDISLFIAIALAVAVYIFMNKTTLGYELRACGFNKNSAKYAGMNEKRNIVLSMVIAGGLAACGASLYYLGGKIELAWNTYNALPADGFNGIPAALLASNNPIGVIFSAIFLRYIDKGGFNLSGYTAFNEYVSDLIIAVIIYFAGFSKLIRDSIRRGGGKKSRKSAASSDSVNPANFVSKEGQSK